MPFGASRCVVLRSSKGRSVAVTASSVGDLRTLVGDFERSLRAANRSPKTVTVYGDAAHGLIRFLVSSGMSTEASQVRREHVEVYIEEQLARWRPATASIGEALKAGPAADRSRNGD
jgi:hypothetical protein